MRGDQGAAGRHQLLHVAAAQGLGQHLGEQIQKDHPIRIFLALLGIVSGLAVLLGALELADAMGKTGPVLFQQIGAMLLCGLPMIALCVCVAGLAVCDALDRMAKEAAARPVALAGQAAPAGDWVNLKRADAVASPVKPETAEWWSDKNHSPEG